MPQKSADLLPTSRLNRKIWKGAAIIEPVRRRLLSIARNFIEEIEFLQTDVIDIVLTGSMASYSWTKNSDLDLHILVDFSTIDRNTDLVGKYVNAKKTIWNNKHNIRIFGFEVEVYIQDINEPHHAEGIYSLQSKNWVQKPKRMKVEIDNKAVNAKVNYFTHAVDYAYDLNIQNQHNDAHELANKLKEKISKMRETGLEREGAWSTENLAFKLLRNNGVIDKLHNLATHSYDDTYSYPQKNYNGKIIMQILSEMSNNVALDVTKCVNAMPENWKIHIDHNNESNMYILRLLNENGQVVPVINEQNPQIVLKPVSDPDLSAFTIINFETLAPYGTLMYDIALELAENKGIVPDYEYLSPTSYKIWEYYRSQRKDVILKENSWNNIYYKENTDILAVLRAKDRLVLTNNKLELRESLEEDEDEADLLEIEPFQASVRAKHSKNKSALINRGNNKKKEKCHTKASMKRAKSAPPGAGGV